MVTGAIMICRFECVQMTVGSRLHTAGMGEGMTIIKVTIDSPLTQGSVICVRLRARLAAVLSFLNTNGKIADTVSRIFYSDDGA